MDAILNVLFVSSFVLLKMPGGGKCVFNSDWVLDGAYKDWLQVVKGDKHAAYCKLCCREFKLASMGKAALKSDMEGTRHQIETLKIRLKL